MTLSQMVWLIVAAAACAFALGMRLDAWMRKRELQRGIATVGDFAGLPRQSSEIQRGETPSRAMPEPHEPDELDGLERRARLCYSLMEVIEENDKLRSGILTQTSCPLCGSTCRAQRDQRPERPEKSWPPAP